MNLTQEAGQVEIVVDLNAEPRCEWPHDMFLGGFDASHCMEQVVAFVRPTRCQDGKGRAVCQTIVDAVNYACVNHITCWPCRGKGIDNPLIKNCWKVVAI